MRNKKVLVFIIILAVLIGISAILIIDTPNALQTTDPIRLNSEYRKDPDWLTYTDQKYPISFDYPANGVFDVGTLSKEEEHNMYVTNSKGPTEESEYTIWFSLVPKSLTPADCIEMASKRREYSTRHIAQITIYEAKGTAEDRPNLYWQIVCVDIPNEAHYLSLTTTDFSDGTIIQRVIDSVRIF